MDSRIGCFSPRNRRYWDPVLKILTHDPMNTRGAPERQESNDASRDEAVAERLWERSEELTGVSYDFGALPA